MPLQFVRDQLSDSVINSAKIDSSAVTAAKIAAGAVTTAKIANDAVTSDHLAAGAVDNTAVGSGIAFSKLAAPSAAFSLNNQKITNLATGTNSLDAVNYAQMNAAIAAVVSGDNWEDTVLAFESDPPASPSAGDRYIVEATATGAWTSQEDKIAEYSGSSWSFTTPTTGTFIDVQAVSNALYYYGGSSWSKKEFEATVNGDGLSLSGRTMSLASSVGGAGLAFNSGVLSVNAGQGLEVNSDSVRIAASAAGKGISGGAGVALSVELASNSGLAFDAASANGKLQIASGLAGDGLSLSSGVMSIASTAAGDGLDIASGVLSLDLKANSGLEISSTELALKNDSTTGATVSPLNIGANGVGLKVDNDTLQHTSGELKIKNISQSNVSSMFGGATAEVGKVIMCDGSTGPIFASYKVFEFTSDDFSSLTGGTYNPLTSAGYSSIVGPSMIFYNGALQTSSQISIAANGTMTIASGASNALTASLPMRLVAYCVETE